MQKNLLKFFVILCSVSTSVFLFTTLAVSEDITITTYYPSPYGVYNELQSRRMAVGDTNSDGNITSADQPSRDGDIRITPQSGNPSTWFSGREGQIAYSDSQDSLYLYNGSDWVSAGGGGVCVVTYDSPVGSCRCPSGWTLKIDLGSWGDCSSTGSGTFFRPPGGGCPGGFPILYRRGVSLLPVVNLFLESGIWEPGNPIFYADI